MGGRFLRRPWLLAAEWQRLLDSRQLTGYLRTVEQWRYIYGVHYHHYAGGAVWQFHYRAAPLVEGPAQLYVPELEDYGVEGKRHARHSLHGRHGVDTHAAQRKPRRLCKPDGTHCFRGQAIRGRLQLSWHTLTDRHLYTIWAIRVAVGCQSGGSRRQCAGSTQPHARTSPNNLQLAQHHAWRPYGRRHPTAGLSHGGMGHPDRYGQQRTWHLDTHGCGACARLSDSVHVPMARGFRRHRHGGLQRMLDNQRLATPEQWQQYDDCRRGWANLNLRSTDDLFEQRKVHAFSGHKHPRCRL